MISKFFLKNMGKNFLFVSCFTSSMLIGMDSNGNNEMDWNDHYALQPLEKVVTSEGTTFPILVVGRKQGRVVRCIDCERDFQKAFLDQKKKNIVHIKFLDGTIRMVDVKAK